MPLAFVPGLTLSTTRSSCPTALQNSALHGRRLRLCMPAPARRPIVHHTACTTAVEKGPKKDKDPAAEEEGDDALDETAMRAAEIHEVLSGLKDFKNRIITDATKLAKKVRAPKKQLEAALASHPDILKIDGHIAELEEELKVLGDR